MKKLILLVIFAIVTVWSCKNNEVLSPADQVTKVDLEVNGMQNLGGSFWYEGWLIWGDLNEFHQSVGVFTVNEQGQLSQTAFQTSLGYLQQAQKFLITIEADDVPGYIVTSRDEGGTTVYDSVEGPSAYQIMGAVFKGNFGSLAAGHLIFFDFEFSQASGTCLLDTPTDTSGSNPKSGIWFVNKDTSNAIVSGLNLPVVVGGWIYEGWVDVNGVLLSTGSFFNPGIKDQSNQFCDPAGTPYAFPGEDFLVNPPAGVTFPLDLSGRNVLIELRPAYPVDCNPPFSMLQLLSVTIPGNAQPQTIYELENNATSLPSGTVSINTKLYEVE
jgi:hypothetical protein